MFVNGLEIGSDGRIVTSQGAVAPGDGQSGAFSYDPLTRGVRADVLVPQYYANGFGFNAGRLCIGAGPITSFHDGLPFNALGQLVTDGSGAVVGARGGWPLTAGGLATAPTAILTTWNPADKSSGFNNGTLSNGNLTFTGAGSGGQSCVRANVGRNTGKYYFEILASVVTNPNMPICGVASNARPIDQFADGGFATSGDYGVIQGSPATKYTVYYANSNMVLDVGGTTINGDVFMFAISFPFMWVGRTGIWCQGNPATLTSPVLTTLAGTLYPFVGHWSGGVATGRFTRASMGYPVPSGFSAWDGS